MMEINVAALLVVMLASIIAKRRVIQNMLACSIVGYISLDAYLLHVLPLFPESPAFEIYYLFVTAYWFLCAIPFALVKSKLSDIMSICFCVNAILVGLILTDSEVIYMAIDVSNVILTTTECLIAWTAAMYSWSDNHA